MKSRVPLAAILLLAVLDFGQASAGDAAHVDIKLFQFKPKTLSVKTGATVRWKNGDAITHSVTSGEPEKPTAAFDSDFFSKGESFIHTFAEPGTYTYFCKRHENMRASVVVTE